MTKLSAFVGHSFHPRDQMVVDSILRLLTTIANLMPDFSWDHALEAEPKQLHQKVKEKMEGKNLFIGICTAKEYGIELEHIETSWFRKSALTAHIKDVQKKTSDWVIQEIGMAIGRGMQIVLLMEDGVRDPGGLHGDLEYIPFDRQHPDKCLEKLVSMLRSLAPASAQVGELQQPATSDVSAQPAEADPFTEFFTPDDSWTSARFLDTYRFAIEWKESTAQQAIETAFRKSRFVSDLRLLAEFEAIGISVTAAINKTEWLQPLRELRAKYPNSPAPSRELAERYAGLGECAAAAEQYELAAIVVKDDIPEMIRLGVLAAEQHHKAGSLARTNQLLDQVAEILQAHQSLEANALLQLARYWKSVSHNELFEACAERYLELNPDSTDFRFELAYKYSELRMPNHAAFHYRQHLKVKDSDMAWNNFGVAAAALKLPTVAIDAYRIAHEQGNTLASSNMAFALLEAGFATEASKICETALLKANPDARVLEAKLKCERIRDEETDREKPIFEATHARRMMLRKVGRASIQRIWSPIPKIWQVYGGTCTAELVGSKFTLIGTYPSSPLSNLGRALVGGGDQDVRFTIKFVGSLVGRAYIGQVTISSTPSQSLLGVDTPKEFIAAFDDSLHAIEVLANDKDVITLRAVTEARQLAAN